MNKDLVKEKLIIKIHLCGIGEHKKNAIDLLFNSKITDSIYKTKGDREFKCSVFYCIIKIYEDKLLTEEKCNEIEENIENDKTDCELKINHHILLLFGDENDMDMILDEFSDINRPRIIFVTNNKKIIAKSKNKKYVTKILFVRE